MLQKNAKKNADRHINSLEVIKNFVLPMLLFDYGYWLNKTRQLEKKTL